MIERSLPQNEKRTSVSSSSPSNKYDSASFGGAVAVSDILFSQQRRLLFESKRPGKVEKAEDYEA